jgi:Spx/MgsR family transcriptional regulator
VPRHVGLRRFRGPEGVAQATNEAVDHRTVHRYRTRMTVTIYGIKNCDTMKKARAWLDCRGVEYIFHDYKTAGIERERLERWAKKVGWETLLNRAGTTFRKLSNKDKEGLSEKKALALMLAQPSIIKRPVLEQSGKLLVGFKPEQYEDAFAARR